MTVAELISELQKLDPRLEVLRDLHSEFIEVDTVSVLTGLRPKGGYVSRPYPPLTGPVRDYVYIG